MYNRTIIVVAIMASGSIALVASEKKSDNTSEMPYLPVPPKSPPPSPLLNSKKLVISTALQTPPLSPKSAQSAHDNSHSKNKSNTSEPNSALWSNQSNPDWEYHERKARQPNNSQEFARKSSSAISAAIKKYVLPKNNNDQ